MVYTYIRNEEGHFICPHCKVIKKNQNTMHYHMKKHEGDLPHECSHCKQRFLQLNILNLHLKSKHADKENLTVDEFCCPCKGCEYSSSTKSNRRIHYLRVHMKDLIGKLLEKVEAAHNCKLCQQSFNSQTAFYYHVGKCVKLEEGDARKDEFAEIMG